MVWRIAVLSSAIIGTICFCCGKYDEKPALRLKKSEEPMKGLYEYQKLANGTWKDNGKKYQYRLILSGYITEKGQKTIIVCLSNTHEVSFEKAYQVYKNTMQEKSASNKEIVIVDVL